ncbi:rhodanese-like domain-containing protein [Bizionia argentinensis JUB59]|uniref:Rhodanese-like domain-containing protein n=1 Tax=Bizionia argentinensis JUB59 TaxID=1046627 RepID=G2EE98_9FLAO|nr:rhodanese-like domain-containing protein [Bizionia argentinensis]EGV43247.1 rhodanese-like domain-containing protein [Bizionia argentinensis JUB59]
MADLTQKQWREQLEHDDQAVVLDVRTDEEVAEGMIPNAIQMDIFQAQEFVSKLGTLDKDKNYYVYCRSGGRSAQACAIMFQMGFDQAHNLLEGITGWTGNIVQP